MGSGMSLHSLEASVFGSNCNSYQSMEKIISIFVVKKCKIE